MKTLDRPTVHNAAAWACWMAENASTSKGVSLTLAKKGTKDPTSLSQNEAVEEALCHGWINGQGHTIDEKTYMQRFTPRVAKSVWSKRNVGLVERLESEGRMQDAGRAAVQSAQEDGRWQRAYSGAANLDEMQDLLDAVTANPAASIAWENLNQGHRSQIYFRLSSLQTQAGRAKVVREFVGKLERGETGTSATTQSQSTSKVRKRTVSKHDERGEREAPAKVQQTKTTRSGMHSRPPAS